MVGQEETRDEAYHLLGNTLRTLVSEKAFGNALAIEWKLYLYLSKIETELEYDRAYSLINAAYRTLYRPKNPINRTEPDRRVVFVIHNANFLAHVVCLYQLMRDRAQTEPLDDSSVSIILLEEKETPEIFEFPWRQLGVGFIRLRKAPSYAERLIDMHTYLSEQDVRHVVWVCTPFGLPFFSAIHPNVVWWSFKMHPSMPYVKKRVCGGHHRLGEQVSFNGFNWYNFQEPQTYINQLKKPLPFKDRDHAIGAFCREAMIDNLGYWSLIRDALNQDRSLQFYYAGRQEIHNKWISRLSIDPAQVKYLGWLREPENYLRQVKALVDPPALGHGVLAREAIHAEVPIIFSWGQDAKNSATRRLIPQAQSRGVELKLNELAGYGNGKSFNALVQQMTTEESNFKRATIEAKKILPPQHTWLDFVKLLEVENDLE